MTQDAQWIKLKLSGEHKDLDTLTAIMSMVDNGLLIEDYSDCKADGVYGDLIDESILEKDPNLVSVSVFIPACKRLPEAIAFIKERLATLALSATISTEGMKEEDWAETWKAYYKPIKLKKVTVVPAWENYHADGKELIIRMDPGMAFGTGTHETTRLVMEMLEDYIKGGERVLDLGCGSGILSLCASKLGASFCSAYDIDPVAVRVAQDNIATDGATNVCCGVSDLLKGVSLDNGKFDFAVANIVADIILRLLPDIGAYLTDEASLIVSGIIGPRAQEVREGIRKHNFKIVEERYENDWLAILIKKDR